MNWNGMGCWQELEDEFYKEKSRVEHLYEKKNKALQVELEETQETSSRRLRKVEDALRLVSLF